MNFDPSDISYLGPELAVFFFALLVLLFPLLFKGTGRTATLGTSVLGLVVAGIINFQNLSALDGPRAAFAGMLAIDQFGLFLKFVILLGAIGALLISHDFLDRVDVKIVEFQPLVLFSVFGMMLMVSANDLMLLFIALEVMSIALYVLTGVNRGELASAEAALKYFIMGAFTSAFLLMGIAFTYGATGTTRLAGAVLGADLQLPGLVDWFATQGHGLAGDPLLATGLGLMLVGFGFKMAAAPFHMWSPDVYQGAPAPVTAFMAGGVKTAAVAALARVLFVAFLGQKLEFETTLWIIAALTMVLGNLGALVQTDLKRMLAFSSIGHAGYILMAIAAAPATGLADNPRLGGILFYLLTYTIMILGAFAVITLLTRDGSEDTRIDRLAGLADAHPLVALGLSICLLSLAGIPPTMGFVGKFYLFAAAVEGGMVWLAVVGALGGAIGIYYYLRPIVLMYMRPATEDALRSNLNGPAQATLALAAVAVLVLGLVPGFLIDAARESLLSLVAWGAL